jgi:hypothetical protein
MKTREGNLKVTGIYSVKTGRRTKPKKKTPYSKVAGELAGRNLNRTFMKYAKQRINK